MVPAPDLLFVEPRPRGSARALAQALTFAYTTGGSQRALEEACGETAPAESPCWSADDLAEALFIPEFVERCMPLPRECRSRPVRPGRTAHVVGVLGRPPADARTVRFRQDILRELANDSHVRDEAVKVYALLVSWWQLLEASYIGQRLDPVRRRLEILRAVQEIIEVLAAGFQESRSGLSRLSEWAARVRESGEYGRLVQLLEHEDRAGVVNLNVQVGRDGEVRRFEIIRIESNRAGPFRTSPFRRFLAKLRLLFLGYRVSEDEVLSRLINAAFEGLQGEIARFFGIMGDLEVYLGAVGLRDLAVSKGLAVCIPDLLEPNGHSRARSIEGLFNPFLLFEKTTPMPCNVAAGQDAIVIVTGPNSAGKTRLVQALGLAQLLAHAGLFVPAQSAALPWAHGLFVSLRAGARADQREGSLGMELLRIRRVFEELDVGGMVILDELCSGTNPSEGEEIFELVLGLLAELEVHAFITTHFLKFAAALERQRPIPNLDFLQAELDEHERPTYQFIRGVAETSLANQTARRLGVTRDELRALIQRKKNRPRPESVPPEGRPSDGAPVLTEGPEEESAGRVPS